MSTDRDHRDCWSVPERIPCNGPSGVSPKKPFYFPQRLYVDELLNPLRLCLLASFGVFLTACTHGPSCKQHVTDYNVSKLKSEVVAIDKGDIAHTIYIFPGPTKRAPPVLLMHELPGLSPKTLHFAEALSKDFTVYVPLLFGSPNQESSFLGSMAYFFNGEWRERDGLNGSRNLTRWLSAVIDRITCYQPGQPIGIIGMCLTGAMPLALLNNNPEVKALVVAQPTLPFFGKATDLGIAPEEWDQAKRRIKAGEVQVYAVRFQKDTIAKRAKHRWLKNELGAKAFVDREILAQEYVVKDELGNTTYIRPDAHSTLTFEWCPDLPANHPITVRRCEVREFLKKRLEQGAVYSSDGRCAVSQHES